jgi:antirestriction protein ArdC
MTADRIDIYTRVTDRIISDLENGVRPWLKPWNADHAAGRITRPLRHSGEPYRGINVLMLWASAELQGFSCPLWVTFRQAKELGGYVRKGEKGSPVVYSSSITKTVEEDDGGEQEQEVHFLKQYTVFNAEQVEGLAASLTEKGRQVFFEQAGSEEFRLMAFDRWIKTEGRKYVTAAQPDPPNECHMTTMRAVG